MDPLICKIPFILSVLYGMHATMTPPKIPSPSSEERLKPGGMEKLAPWVPPLAKVGHWTMRAFFWVSAFCEILLILSGTSGASSLWVFRRFSPWLVLNSRSINPSYISFTPSFLIGWILNLAGSQIRIRCYRILGARFTFDLSIRQKHELVQDGPYSYVRHPSYTGAVLALVGAGVTHLTEGSWLVEYTNFAGSTRVRAWVWVVACSIAASALIPRMAKEDRMLRSHFGVEWDKWAARVPSRLVPGLY
ncbi:hypothetical protein HGRIS_006300 [Hohenbuehelia grisea]|uniref:Protein-S-isoprenylcysteine O-methyltransferase n=1 Tax=Hohenbuehelia grisea TaxID=104357 RepID=A0ABR3K0H5_9AGAR